MAVGRRHVLMTSGRLTNAVYYKVARKVIERMWNDSTVMTHSRNYTCTMHISSYRSIMVGKIDQYVPSPQYVLTPMWRVVTCSIGRTYKYRFIRSQ